MPRGGIPYEINAGALYQETWTDTRAFFRFGETTPGFTNATWMHAPGTATAPRSPSRRRS